MNDSDSTRSIWRHSLVEFLILSTLRRKGPLRPSAIKSEIESRSGGLFNPKRSSILTALGRLGGALDIDNIPSATGKIVTHYKLTPAGQERLSELSKYWRQAIKGIDFFLYGHRSSDGHNQEHAHSIPDAKKCIPGRYPEYFKKNID